METVVLGLRTSPSKLRQLKQLLRRIIYKPSWRIELLEDCSSYGDSYVRFGFIANDVTDPKNRIPIQLGVNAYEFEHMDEKTMIDFIFYQLMRLERHEASEWFKVDGKAIFNEHDEQNRKNNLYNTETEKNDGAHGSKVEGRDNRE